MNPIVEIFVKKYAAGILARGLQLFGTYLIVKHKWAPADVSTFMQAINPGDIVAWFMVVGPELYHAWSNKGHAVLQDKANDAAVEKASPQHGATGLMTLLFVFLCVSTNAQTTNTNNLLMPAMPEVSIPGLTIGGGVPTNIVRSANELLTIVDPIIPYLTNITGVALDMDGIYSTSNKIGFLAALNVSVPELTNYLTVGAMVEDVADKWYLSPLDTKLGVSYTIPLINIPAYSFVGTGLSWRMSDGALGDQTLIGEAVVIPLGSVWYIAIDGGYMVLTQPGTPENNYFGGARLGRSL